jgi:DNA polymerase-1
MNPKYLELFKELEQDRIANKNTTKNSRILILDGLNTFIRVFSAVPALNDDGQHIGGVAGFLKSVAAAIRQHKPTRCIIVFDGKGGSRRRKDLYPDYKANRANKTAFNRHQEFASLQDEQESMKFQYGRLIQYLQLLPVTLLAIDQVEADDVIAYIANEIYTDAEHQAIIYSTDRDFLQLVNDRISVYSPIKKKLYTPDVMREEFGFDTKNYLLYRAFTGDVSDNIPGVSGVGGKSLIKHFPMFSGNEQISVDDVIAYAAAATGKYKVFERVRISEDVLRRNYQLMQLKEVDMSGQIKSVVRDIVTNDINRMNVFEFKKMFMADKMYTTIKDLDTWLPSSFNTLNTYTSL